jgi:biopolymer transport protein ExbD
VEVVAEKRQSVDVHIVETNVVYREVPYTVVVDWVQQGRLLEDDRLRLSGTADWLPLGQIPAFAAYLPRVEPFRAEDRAEALEPVEVDFAWKHPRGDEDEDVDMIPLIDVSLVLLIFFMMTASVVGAAAFINTPPATTADLSSNPQMLWIGIDRTADNRPLFFLGEGDKGALEGDAKLSEKELLQRLEARLKPNAKTEVRIRADRNLPYDVVKKLTLALEALKSKRMIGRVFAEVSERETP